MCYYKRLQIYDIKSIDENIFITIIEIIVYKIIKFCREKIDMLKI